MSKFIITEWVVHPFDFEFTVKRNKPEDLNYEFRVLNDDGNVCAIGYSDKYGSSEPLEYCKKYCCTQIRYDVISQKGVY